MQQQCIGTTLCDALADACHLRRSQSISVLSAYCLAWFRLGTPQPGRISHPRVRLSTWEPPKRRSPQAQRSKFIGYMRVAKTAVRCVGSVACNERLDAVVNARMARKLTRRAKPQQQPNVVEEGAAPVTDLLAYLIRVWQVPGSYATRYGGKRRWWGYSY